MSFTTTLNPASLITSVASLFGSTQTTTGNSSGTARTSNVGTATSLTQANQGTTTSQNLTGNQLTTNQSQTINTADAQGIATLRQLINSALTNSSNTDQTNSLVAGIFQSAKDAFASTYGTQASSGLYNSATTGVLASDAEARATADAASAVLTYQTNEQQIANQGLQQLLAATGISTSSGTSDTASQQQQTGVSNTTATTNTVQGSTQIANSKQATTQQTTQVTSPGSIICTWMINNDMMGTRTYYRVSKQFYRDYSNSNPLLGPLPPDIIQALQPSTPPTTKADGSSTPQPTPSDSLAVGKDSGVNSFFNNIGATIGNAAAQIQTAFGLGKQAGQEAAQASSQQSSALLQAAQAKAAVTANDATQQAKEADANSRLALQLGLTGPDMQKTASAINQNMQELRNIQAQRTKDNNVSFWDNPGQYLVNQIVKVPIEESRIADRVENLRNITTGVSTAAAAMQAGSLASAAVNSVNTSARVAALVKQDLATGLANAQEPLTRDAQIQISALNLAVSAAGEIVKTADAQARLPLVQSEVEEAPINLALKQQQLQYYSAAKQLTMQQKMAMIQEQNAKTQLDNLRATEIKQKLTDEKEALGTINIGRASLGQKPISALTDLPTNLQKDWLKVGVNTQSGGGPGYGPYDTVQTMKKLGVFNTPGTVPDGQLVTVKDILEASSQAEKEGIAGKLSTRPGDGGERSPLNQFVDNEVVNSFIQRQGYKLDSATGKYVPGKGMSDDPANPDKLFGPEPLTTMVTRHWAKDNPILQAMVPATIDGNGRKVPNVPTVYGKVLETASGLVAQGKLTK
ncbi:unnamed protein product, partial [Sphagnum jensenii]